MCSEMFECCNKSEKDKNCLLPLYIWNLKIKSKYNKRGTNSWRTKQWGEGRKEKDDGSQKLRGTKEISCKDILYNTVNIANIL